MRLIFILFIVLNMTSSCSSSKTTIPEQTVKIAEIEREEYVLLDKVEKAERNTKIWILFIPFGGKKEQKLRDLAYNKAVESVPEADGLIKPRYEYKKITIPLILFTVTVKTMTVTAKAYRLKTDDELKETLKN